MTEIHESTDDRQYSFSKEAFDHFLNWVFFAALAFICVILFYQFLVSGISLALGYETHIHFGKVESLPHRIDYWSNTRVLILYFFPPVLLLVVGIGILGVLLLGSPKINFWTWFRFWLMVFSLLFSTTLLSLSFYSWAAASKPVFQGFAVIVRWYGLTYIWSVIFASFAVILNFAVGFACSYILINVAPGDFMVKKGKRYPRKIVLTSFVYTILFVFVVSMILSYPDSINLFLIMFGQSILWLPGLLNITNESLRKRKISRNKLEIMSFTPYKLFIALAILTLVVRIVIN